MLGAIAFLAAGASGLQTRLARSLPSVGLMMAVVITPIWMGWAGATGTGALIAWCVSIVACAIVPSATLARERRAHSETRRRLRAVEQETGVLRRETSLALPELRGGGYDHAERDRDLRNIGRELQLDIDRACSLLVSATGAAYVGVYRPDGDAEDLLVAVAGAGDTRGIVPEVGAREGIFGAAFKTSSPVCLKSPHPGDTRIVHREGAMELGAVLVQPLCDGDRKWGVIVLDATTPDALDARGREIAGAVSDFVARLISRTVDLSAVREGMRENHAFYEACREVSRHVRIADIADAVAQSAGAFVEMDCAAVALCNERGDQMSVVSSTGFDPEPPTTSFPVTAGEGLLAQAVRHRTMIERGSLKSSGVPPVLFGRDAGAWRGCRTLLVLPIFAPGGGMSAPLGALVIGRREGADFSGEDSERLKVLLAQAGAAISNGRLFAQHEERGITDGMTGLPNHRRFQEVLGEKIAAAGRSDRRVALLLVDIDKFKSVNDSYGHPMGDEVIRRLAGVLSDAVRDGTDLAARYGGEEFCVVLEDTDARGAETLANRVREAFRQEVFVHRDGSRPVTFRCSISIGIACWPEDSSGQTEMIDRADQALYRSKENGRDRVTRWDAPTKSLAASA
jgi:diguanylate cyclase (GGDEF)-like protein